MKNGFGLAFGPFELMDKLGKTWIKEKFLETNLKIPKILNNLTEEKFYKVEDQKLKFFDFISNKFVNLNRPNGIILLSDLKRIKEPIQKISNASLWDLGDGVTVFEIHSRGNSIDMSTMQFLDKSIDTVSNSYKAMVIYNEGSMFQQVQMLVKLFFLAILV